MHISWLSLRLRMKTPRSHVYRIYNHKYAAHRLCITAECIFMVYYVWGCNVLPCFSMYHSEFRSLRLRFCQCFILVLLGFNGRGHHAKKKPLVGGGDDVSHDETTMPLHCEFYENLWKLYMHEEHRWFALCLSSWHIGLFFCIKKCYI